MAISYNKLWKLLIDLNMKKKDLEVIDSKGDMYYVSFILKNVKKCYS